MVRTPFLSYKKSKEIFNLNEITKEKLKNISSAPAFLEAIFLASPYLYLEIKKWLEDEKSISQIQYQKLKNTILKYYSRMSTRCTPFGLFSGIGYGKFNDDLTSPLLKFEKLRDTKLDMHFLVSLSEYLVKIPVIKNQILFSPNNSIYIVGNKIRYIEYEYSNGKRDYIISSADLSKELQNILNFSEQGKSIQQIAEILINDEINIEEAIEFVEELISNQILISELEPTVSGKDFFDRIIQVLNNNTFESEVKLLLEIKNKLNNIDLNIGNQISKYLEIEKLLQDFNIEYEQKYLFQTDLYFQNTIDIPFKWKNELKKGLILLNKITFSQKNTPFEKFKKSFYKRFNTQEVPLAYVLDTEIGIGYRQDTVSKGLHPYLEDLNLPAPSQTSDLKIELNPFQQMLNLKIQEALLRNDYKIELVENDIKDFEEKWDDLPDTISIMAEIISEGIHEKIFINGGGGSSAANLSARFCSEKTRIKNFTNQIAKEEEELNTDYVLAEIIHLPQARIGNVIRRPSLREYEIPYLASSIYPTDQQIAVNDLYISLKNGKIILRSKKLNKEIKPYLTNAHNYKANSLPVYHFLCDIYSQNIRTGLYFNWGGLKEIYYFLPRIEYNNIILSKASWKVTDNEIKRFLMLLDDKKTLQSELKNWRKLRQIPKWVQWIKFDNKLIINLESYDLINILFDSVKNEKSIILEEFLHNENTNFVHEFVFPVLKKKK